MPAHPKAASALAERRIESPSRRPLHPLLLAAHHGGDARHQLLPRQRLVGSLDAIGLPPV